MKHLRYVALVLVWLALSGLVWFWPPKELGLEVSFLDVGQGDAALIKTPYGQNILIDGGPDSKVLEGLADKLPWAERKIDLVILTHQHEDHLGGLLKVFERYEVANVIYSSASGSPAMAAAWLKALDAEGAKVEKPPERETIVLGQDCELEIINPAYFYKGKDLNEYSLVSILDCGRRIIFMGDAGKTVERWLIGNGFDVSAEGLKVGHHGSLSASSEEFLKAVRPSWAVISAGKGNRYGLPNGTVVDRLKDLGIITRRTDEEGAISVGP